MTKPAGIVFITLGAVAVVYLGIGFFVTFFREFSIENIVLAPLSLTLWFGPGVLLIGVGRRLWRSEPVLRSRTMRHISMYLLTVIGLSCEFAGLLAAWTHGVPVFILAALIPPFAVAWGLIDLLRGFIGAL